MQETVLEFTTKKVSCIFGASLQSFLDEHKEKNVVLISDENVYNAHLSLFDGFRYVVLPAGEKHKQQGTIDHIIKELLHLQADKDSLIIGIGGGVVTDMAGFAASIFKRGIHLVLVPTSVLAMVDASVGGKNGVDVGVYKNMVGTIHQPDKILFDYSLLKSLPAAEWINGFAEIIKHACIKDAGLFDYLASHSIQDFINGSEDVEALMQRNVMIKAKVVLSDEFETGERKLLNFGHTLGHAIENIYHLPHGHAISIGMMAACTFSQEINAFESSGKARVQALLEQYGLPVKLEFDKQAVWDVLLMDKKRKNGDMNFVLLNRIGEAVVKKISLVQLKDMIAQSL